MPVSQLSIDSRNCRQGSHKNLGLQGVEGEHCIHGPFKVYAQDRARNIEGQGYGLCNVSRNRTD